MNQMKNVAWFSGLALMVCLQMAGTGSASTTSGPRGAKTEDSNTANSIQENGVARPNFVIIFTDDQGYADLGCFGSTKIKTPHIDRMAEEGCRFTSFLVGSSVCSPSRAALLTDCYPKRVGLHKGVLFPDSTSGLHPDEHTIADHLKGLGYATACFGKWHLGHHTETLPTRNGFDEYYGIPCSNDMNHPDDSKKLEGGKLLWSKPDLLWKDQESAITKWNTPLMEGEKIIELPTDQRTVTRRYTDKAIEFSSSRTRTTRSSSTCPIRCRTFPCMCLRIATIPTPGMLTQT